MINMTNRALFIVFDGLDGVGKTTLAKIICQKYNAIYMRALNSQDDIIISNANKKSVPSSIIHNLSLNFIKDTTNQILSLNAAGINVVLDRYIYSCIAYYYAISNIAAQPINFVDYEKYAFPHPDVSFFIHLDISHIMNRNINKETGFTDRLTQNNLIFRKHVTSCLHQMASLKNSFWINNNNSIDITITNIERIINYYNQNSLEKEKPRHYTNAELLPVLHKINTLLLK